MEKTLQVILGPTGVGKTAYALRQAERLGCPILNADSRQLYRQLPIGTAAPTAGEQARVRHYFVGTLDLEQTYSAAQYEADALALLDDLFRDHDTVVLSGGSFQNMYIMARLPGMLREKGFRVWTHSRVSCNDEGLSLGQLMIALHAGC